MVRQVLMIFQLSQSFLQAMCPCASEELKYQVVSAEGEVHGTRQGVSHTASSTSSDRTCSGCLRLATAAVVSSLA